MRSTLQFGILALGPLAYAATHTVDVGEGGLVYKPNSITAAKGDIVEFHFYPGDHNVAQGAFDKPCTVGGVTNGFYSGFITSSSGEADKVFRVTVNSTDPMWFYCSQSDHCQEGMAGVINPPSSGDTIDAYIKAAGSDSSQSETPSAVQGGIVAASSGDDDASSSAATTSESSTSASAAETSATSTESSSESSSKSSTEATSAAGSATSTGGSVASSVTSAAATATKNAGGKLHEMSLEMLGLLGVAGGMAVLL